MFPFICDGKLTKSKNEGQILGEMHWQDGISKDQGSLEFKLVRIHAMLGLRPSELK